ncbi:MAG: gas vesicle protein K [Verrucomicrobia bacterium]|nr:gas vesicle protein K [Verrucomicrobiota bacterium]MCF7707512.1 gas vesicle protein K [Verrucomicrobiota bacterium]
MNRSLQQTDNVSLVEALDKILEKGAVVEGELAIRLADVDLVYAGLRIMLTSISKAEELGHRGYTDPNREASPEELREIERIQAEIRKAERNIPRLIDAADPENAEKGIAKLVLTLIELIRQLMEKEAYRRVKKGSLSAIEIQKLGLSLKAMRKKLQELQAVFGIEDEDLNVDLGPLGNLL